MNVAVIGAEAISLFAFQPCDSLVERTVAIGNHLDLPTQVLGDHLHVALQVVVRGGNFLTQRGLHSTQIH